MINKIVFPKEKIVVVDVEGNGQVPPDLIEVAVQIFSPNSDHQQKASSWLIKPPRPIIQRVIDIHGIDNFVVKDCPGWSEVKDEIEKKIDGVWFVAHNASVDFEALKRHIPHWVPIGIIDTIRLAKHVIPHAPSYSLGALIKETGVLADQPVKLHRAEYDVNATTSLFRFLIAKSKATNWAQICKIAMQPISDHSVQSPEQGQLW